MQNFLHRESRRFPILFLARAIMAAVLACHFSFYPLLAHQTVIDTHGSADDALAQGRGKVSVLVFVRTDCPISNRYAPLLQQMNKKYRQQASSGWVFPTKTNRTKKFRVIFKTSISSLLPFGILNPASQKKT